MQGAEPPTARFLRLRGLHARYMSASFLTVVHRLSRVRENLLRVKNNAKEIPRPSGFTTA